MKKKNWGVNSNGDEHGISVSLKKIKKIKIEDIQQYYVMAHKWNRRFCIFLPGAHQRTICNLNATLT